MNLKSITPGVWGTEIDFPLGAGIYFPTRMTIIEAAPGQLLIHSPVPIDDEMRAEIDRLGEVRWIIGPNALHHTYLPDAAKTFPDAEVWGTSGVLAKRSEIAFAGNLSESRPATLPESIVPLAVAGVPSLNETVFWLPDAETLVCSDLVFNMHDPSTFMTRLLLKAVVGNAPGPRQSRSFRWFFVKDREANAEFLHDLIERDFDNLVMAHGDVVLGGGARALEQAAKWVLDGRLAGAA